MAALSASQAGMRLLFRSQVTLGDILEASNLLAATTKLNSVIKDIIHQKYVEYLCKVGKLLNETGRPVGV